MPSESEIRARRPRWPWVAGGLLAVLPIVWGINRLVPPPSHLGVSGGRLAACPDSPNCVGSQGADTRHAIEPLAMRGTAEESLERLRRLVESMPGARLVRADPPYLHFEMRTRICRFVDDLEFLADPAASVIHVRSASRLGYSDLGANRARVEGIRSLWGG